MREVRGKGVLLGVELVEDPRTNAALPGRAQAGRRPEEAPPWSNGLILRIDPDWFAVSPPLIAEEADLDELVDLIRASLEAAIARVRP